MRRVRVGLAAGVLLIGTGCSGGGSSSTPSTLPTPAPTPTPTPEPAGSVRFVSATLPSGSTVPVWPLGAGDGQQAPDLSFTGAFTLKRAVADALVRAWVGTPGHRCMGGGILVSFQANTEQEVWTGSMSAPATAGCVLPYSTTQVEFEVTDLAVQQVILTQPFPASYDFVPGR